MLHWAQKRIFIGSVYYSMLDALNGNVRTSTDCTSQTTSTLQHVRNKRLQSIFVVFFLFRLCALFSLNSCDNYTANKFFPILHRCIESDFCQGLSEVM